MPSDRDLVALKKRRITIKASCTCIKTYIGSVNAVLPSVIAQLEERKLKLEQYWSEYDAIQSEIESKDKGDR